jgi:hypothetical protein
MVLGRATATGFLWGKHWAKALPLCVRQFGSIHAGKHTASLGLQTRPSVRSLRAALPFGQKHCRDTSSAAYV